LGFRHVGRVRVAFWLVGRWWDEVGLGMLEEEWREMQEKEKERVSKKEAVVGGDEVISGRDGEE
jgi:hypothetical protein